MKRGILQALYAGCKSPKGSVDAPIVDFIHALNTDIPDLVTTSSCSGRVSIFHTPGGAASAGVGAKGTGTWLLSAHHQVTLDEVTSALAACPPGESDLVTLKVEPFLLHVETRDVDTAAWFVTVAHSAGFRESGIMLGKGGARVMAHVRTTSHTLEVPLRVGGATLVPDTALESLVDFANAKFRVNAQRIGRLQAAVAAATAERFAAPPSTPHSLAVPQQWAGHIKGAIVAAGWGDASRKVRRANFACAAPDAAAALRDLQQAADAFQDPPRKVKVDKATGEPITAPPAPPVMPSPSSVMVVPVSHSGTAALRAWQADAAAEAAALPEPCRPFARQLKHAPIVATAAHRPGKESRPASAAPAAGAGGGGAGDAPPLDMARVSHLSKLHHALRCHAHAAGSPPGMLAELPRKAEVLGDALLIGEGELTHPAWAGVWEAAAAAVGARRVIRKAEVSAAPSRDAQATLLWGPSPWVTVKENGVSYTFDASRVMFSRGNVSEKARMAAQPATGETIVDLYAGIGYFTIPLAKHAGAAVVHAADWNAPALEALRKNVLANGVQDKVKVYEGDNTAMAESCANIADRVMLGLIPSSERGWPIAAAVLKPSGGMLHVHGNVPTTQATRAGWGATVAAAFAELGKALGKVWKVRCVHVEKVKSYAPHVTHAVADIRCVGVDSASETQSATPPPAAAAAEEVVPTQAPPVPSSVSEPSPEPGAVAEAAWSGPAFGAGTVPSVSADSLAAALSHPHEQLWHRRLPLALRGFLQPSACEAFSPANMTAALAEGGAWAADGAKAVAVHQGTAPALQFTPTKNFTYTTMPLRQLFAQVVAAAAGQGGPWLYLRAVGSRPRKDSADLWRDFPQLSTALSWRVFQPWVPPAAYFSSVLRIMAPGMALWTHYDVRDNILLQLHGTKTVTLFPLAAAQGVQLAGSTSTLHGDTQAPPAEHLRNTLWRGSVPEAARAWGHLTAAAASTGAVAVTLHPGDALFIPSCVPHAVSVPSDSPASVGVNVFWHDPRLPRTATRGKDVYGNHDADKVAAARRVAAECVAKACAELPPDYAAFYAGVVSEDVRRGGVAGCGT